MDKPIKLAKKYERNGWPSIPRPDLKLPQGWSLSLLTSLERIRSQSLSPDGKTIAYIRDGETLSEVYVLRSSGAWPARFLEAVYTCEHFFSEQNICPLKQ